MCKADEFSEIRFHSDKTILNQLNKDPLIRFPLKGKISSVHEKVFLLIQAAIGGVSFTESDKGAKSKPHNMSADQALIMRNATRLAKGFT